MGREEVEEKYKAGCQKEVNEELKVKRLKEMELMRAGKGEAMGSKGSSWNQKTQRMLGSPPCTMTLKPWGKFSAVMKGRNVSGIQKCVCLLSHVSRVRLDYKDCSLPGSSVHGMLQAKILEWVTMPSSRGSS